MRCKCFEILSYLLPSGSDSLFYTEVSAPWHYRFILDAGTPSCRSDLRSVPKKDDVIGTRLDEQFWLLFVALCNTLLPGFAFDYFLNGFVKVGNVTDL